MFKLRELLICKDLEEENEISGNSVTEKSTVSLYELVDFCVRDESIIDDFRNEERYQFKNQIYVDNQFKFLSLKLVRADGRLGWAVFRFVDKRIDLTVKNNVRLKLSFYDEFLNGFLIVFC